MLFLAIVMEIADPSTYRLPGSSLWNCIEATVNENMRKAVFQRDQHTSASIRPPIIGGEPMIRWIFLQVRSLASQSPFGALFSVSDLLSSRPMSQEAPLHWSWPLVLYVLLRRF